jgi:hypothetical protein
MVNNLTIEEAHQTWCSPDRPQFCPDFTPGGGSWLVNRDRWADDSGVCCYDTFAFKPLNCCKLPIYQRRFSCLMDRRLPFTRSQVGRQPRTGEYHRVPLLRL